MGMPVYTHFPRKAHGVRSELWLSTEGGLACARVEWAALGYRDACEACCEEIGYLSHDVMGLSGV